TGQFPPIARIDRIHDLISFFEKIRLDGVEGLLAIPGTTTGRPKTGHQVDQRLKFLAGARGRRRCHLVGFGRDSPNVSNVARVLGRISDFGCRMSAELATAASTHSRTKSTADV